MNFRLFITFQDSKEVFQVSGTPKPRLPISKRKDQHVLGQEFILLDECPDPKTPKHAAEGGVVRGKREIVSHMVYIHHCKRLLADILLPHYGISY